MKSIEQIKTMVAAKAYVKAQDELDAARVDAKTADNLLEKARRRWSDSRDTLKLCVPESQDRLVVDIGSRYVAATQHGAEVWSKAEVAPR